MLRGRSGGRGKGGGLIIHSFSGSPTFLFFPILSSIFLSLSSSSSSASTSSIFPFVLHQPSLGPSFIMGMSWVLISFAHRLTVPSHHPRHCVLAPKYRFNPVDSVMGFFHLGSKCILSPRVCTLCISTNTLMDGKGVARTDREVWWGQAAV